MGMFGKVSWLCGRHGGLHQKSCTPKLPVLVHPVGNLPEQNPKDVSIFF